VDDAEHSRGFTATYLEKIGWPPGNILHAESGSQAISKVLFFFFFLSFLSCSFFFQIC